LQKRECYLARDVGQCIPGDFAFVAEHLEVEQRTLAITIIELVLDIPAQGSELLALENNSVEEANTEDHSTPVHAKHYNTKQ
jgi:hypothetical protein